MVEHPKWWLCDPCKVGEHAHCHAMVNDKDCCCDD